MTSQSTRIRTAIAQVEEVISEYSTERQDALAERLDLSLEELSFYQQRKSVAMMDGTLDQATARWLYAKLGDAGEARDETGWPLDTTLAERVIVTKVMAELLGVA